jgi:mannose-6-phosphate isomerase
VVAEVQQSSDTTFRLFDWNRVDRDGRPRTLHVQHALDVIDFQAPAPRPVTPQSTAQPHVQRLIACDKFVVDRWTLTAAKQIGGDGGCHLIVPVSGQMHVEGDAGASPLGLGQTAMLPAAAPRRAVVPRGTAAFLDIHLPT